MSPVMPGARWRQATRAAVVLELWRHQVEVAAAEHRPVNQPLILRACVGSSAPQPKMSKLVRASLHAQTRDRR